MLSLAVSSTGYASVAPVAAVQRAATPQMGFGKAELEGARSARERGPPGADAADANYLNRGGSSRGQQ